VKVPILGWEFPPYFADGVSVVQLVEDLELDFDVVHAHDWATYPAGAALKQASFGAVSPLKRARSSRAICELGPAVRTDGSAELLRSWQRLTTSEHLYYLCTKWSADGDVHSYFSPYDSPYEASA